jgi:hypothetical protein
VDELAAGLSVDSIRAAADWLEIESGKDSWPVEKRATHGAGMTSLHYDRAGTWTVDAATYSVRYRPAAHADPVLASWLEILSAVPQLESRPLELAMFKEMSSVTAAGMCASCHSVERGRAGGLAVNWQVFDRTSAPRMLTKFSHGPHVMLPQLADCASCHAINGTANTSKSYFSYDPHDFTSEFAPVSKQLCSSCHTATSAGESCQKCHNYHVEIVESWRKESRRGAEVAEFRNTNRR